MSNSTLNTSYKDGRTCAYLGARKDWALDKDDKGNMHVIDGNKFQIFFTQLTDDEKAAGKYGELGIPAGHKCYLVEFNKNPKYDYALYDYDTNRIMYHEIKKAGEETKSAGAEKQEAADNTEAAAPENEKTAADSAE